MSAVKRLSIHSFDNFALHASAIAGDDGGVRRALALGGNVNALDAAGRTTIMCAVTGGDWERIDAFDASFMTSCRLNVIRILLSHPDISLLTLNAPQSAMNGVTPLGMAAWLNLVEVVRILLEESAGAVSVDGMDSHGATALMYAARDGSLQVVQVLLYHGARPDFRDRHHRTAVQFALAHPQILWLFEAVLRRHRRGESKYSDRTNLSSNVGLLSELALSSFSSAENLGLPPLNIFTDRAFSTLNNKLVQSILSSDVSLVHSLLFTSSFPLTSPLTLYPTSGPILVNQADFNGWSPIHHCVSAKHPSVDILDALYYAGADISLFTANEHYTPLHCLAQSTRFSVEPHDSTSTLYHFTMHLIRDLCAPLSARDKDDETCIHIAAERGDSVDLLMALLDCDTSGCVRELRNSRGLTALEVARPEFRAAFGEGIEGLRSISSLSDCTIRPAVSSVSTPSLFDWDVTGQTVQHDNLIPPPTDLDITPAFHQLFTNLQCTSPMIHRSSDWVDVDRFDSLLHEASHSSFTIFRYFRSRVEEATKGLKELQVNHAQIGALLDLVVPVLNDKLQNRGLQPFLPRKKNRDSEDSQKTMVSSEAEDDASTGCLSASQLSIDKFSSGDCHQSAAPAESIAGSRRGYRYHTISGFHTNLPPGLLDQIDFDSNSLPHHGYSTDSLQLSHEFHRHPNNLAVKGGEQVGTASFRNVIRPFRGVNQYVMKGSQKERKAKTTTSIFCGSVKLKDWLKRIIMPDRPRKLERSECGVDISEDRCIATSNVTNFGGKNVLIQVEPSEQYDYQTGAHASVDSVLRTSHIVLAAVVRDLLSMEQRLSDANHFISLTNHSILKAEQIVKWVLKKREVALVTLRHASSEEKCDEPFTLDSRMSFAFCQPNIVSPRQSITSLSSPCRLSCVSRTEDEDEEMWTNCKLLMRDIERMIVDVFEEVDKVIVWLTILKEAVRGLKRRAYL